MALSLIKPPGIAETIEWAQAAKLLSEEGARWPVALRRSLGLLVKEAEDTEKVLAHAEAGRDLTARSTTSSTTSRAVPERRIDFLTALRDNQPPDITRLYWLARVTLVARREDIPLFDALFATHFAGAPPVAEPRQRGRERSAAEPRAASCSRCCSARAPARARASTTCATAAATSRPPTTSPSCARRSREHVPQVRSRRLRPRRRGQIDLRRTLRHATRTGEITHLARRGRPHRPRRAAAADRRLRLAPRTHARLPALRLGRAGRDVHVRHAAHADHEGAAPPRRRRRARPSVSDTVDDADGGTRIGAALQEFLDTPALRRPRARRADDRAVRRPRARRPGRRWSHAVRRLKRLSHRLLWWTPLGLDPTYRPVTRAMAAIQRDVELAGARDLPSLLEQVRAL